MTTPNMHTPEFLTVAAMIARLRMSRTRYYQLVKQGVFLPPVYNVRTRRPLCPREIVQRNLLVRETNVGVDGNPVLFNNHRATPAGAKAAPAASGRRGTRVKNALDSDGGAKQRGRNRRVVAQAVESVAAYFAKGSQAARKVDMAVA